MAEITPSVLCRLCLNAVEEYRKLYDTKGHGNDLFYLTLEYFHPKIVDMDKAKHLKRICLECHQKICDFRNFQELIKESQTKLVAYEEEEEVSIKIEKIEDDQFCFTNTNYPEEEHFEEILGQDSSMDNSFTVKTEFMEDSKYSISQEELEILDVPGDDELALEDEDDNFPEGPSNDYSMCKLDDLFAMVMPNIKCEYCTESFSRYRDFRNHCKNVHPNEEFYILCCSRKIKSYKTIVAHMTLHTDPNAYTCKVCGKNLSHSTVLMRHLRQVHGIRHAHKCEFCSKSFEDIKGHNAHMIAKHKKEMLVDDANIQEKSDYTSKKLDSLLAMVMPVIKCVHCTETYSKYRELRRHCKEKHPTKEFYIACCLRKLKVYKTIAAHMTLHADPNAFTCMICGRNLANNVVLQAHLTNTHGINLKHKCEICSKSFQDGRGLYYHMHKMHRKDVRIIDPDIQTKEDGTSSFVCRQCGEPFQSRKAFFVHRTNEHPLHSQFECDQCGKLFKFQKQFKQHLLTHTNTHQNKRKASSSTTKDFTMDTEPLSPGNTCTFEYNFSGEDS